jgi:3-hydroxyacyl-CoA dehydrogenase
MSLAKRLGKLGVLVGNCRGFVGNRMFGPYRREAQFLVEEGASPQQVDQALYNFGLAMGPLATGDLAGLDVGWRIRKEYGETQDHSVRQPLIEDRLCEMGHYGQKTGAGWYKYDENRKPQADADVEALIAQCRTESGVAQRQVSNEEIIERTIYALVNEGARILEEGYAYRSVDIDMIYVTGYGFPAYRGGPMWYADSVGLANVYRRICQFEAQHGSLWTPAPLLKQLAERGGKFADFSRTATARAKGGEA